MDPQVTVITGTFNKPRHLRQAAESVLTQTEHRWRWEIVGDGPNLDTAVELERLANLDSRVHVTVVPTTEDRRRLQYRPAAIFNEVACRVTTPYLCWLSDDDLWRPSFLQEMLAALADGVHHVAYCGYSVVDEVNGCPVFRTAVPAARDRVPGDGFDPIGVLDGGCIVQTKESYDHVARTNPPAIPEGWDTAAYCDGLYLRWLLAVYKFKAVPKLLLTHRRTKLSTHAKSRIG